MKLIKTTCRGYTKPINNKILIHVPTHAFIKLNKQAEDQDVPITTLATHLLTEKIEEEF
jgi:hypothetical protein